VGTIWKNREGSKVIASGYLDCGLLGRIKVMLFEAKYQKQGGKQVFSIVVPEDELLLWPVPKRQFTVTVPKAAENGEPEDERNPSDAVRDGSDSDIPF